MRKAEARLEVIAKLVTRYPDARFSQVPEMLTFDDILAAVLLDVLSHEALGDLERHDGLLGAQLSGPAVLMCAKLLAMTVHAELGELLRPECQYPSVPQ